MMTRNTTADVIIVAMIGERGREVREFVETVLGEHNLKKAIVVAAPADHAPVMRLRGCSSGSSVSLSIFGAREKMYFC